MNTVKNRFRLDLVENEVVNSYYVVSDNLADLKAYLKSWEDNFSTSKLYQIIFQNFNRTYFVDLESYLNNDPRLASDPAHFTEYDELIPYEAKLKMVNYFLKHLNYDLKFQTPINDIVLSEKMFDDKKSNELLSLLEKAEKNTNAYYNINQKISEHLETHSLKIKK